MDSERYIENILGAESLTDALDDDDASWLLDWGIGKLDEVLQGVTDQETADRRANALMAVMRKMNAITGSYAEKAPPSLALDLADHHDLFALAFPPSTARLDRPDFTEDAVRLAQLSSRQVLEYLSGDFTPS